LQRDSQYTVSGAVVTITDTLTSGAVIELNYWKANAVNATNYTKAESDGLLAAKQNTITNPITGTGTANKLAKFTSSGEIENSNINELASGGISIGNPNSTSFFEVSGNKGVGTTVGDFSVDSVNKTVYIGRLSSTPGDQSNFAIRGRTGTEYFTIKSNINSGYVMINNFGFSKDNPSEAVDVNGNIKLSGILILGQYTTATRPAYVKGSQFFDTTINKMVIGGATAWEEVTSS